MAEHRQNILSDKPKKTNGNVEEKKEKKKSKKSKDGEKEKKKRNKSDKSIDLLMSNDTVKGHENEYNELLSPEHEVKSVEEKVSEKKDDLDFWLDNSKPVQEEVKVESKVESSENKKEKKAKKSKKDEPKAEKKKSKSKSKNGHVEIEQNGGQVDPRLVHKHIVSNKHLDIVIFISRLYKLLYLTNFLSSLLWCIQIK